MLTGFHAPLRRALLVLSIACFSLGLAAAPSQGQTFNWLVPTSADTFTVGVPHGLYWTGGPAANVNIFVIDMNTFSNVGYVVLNSPNTGEVVWNIPNTLPQGPYQLYIEDVGTTTWTYSETFFLRTRGTCATGCLSVATTQPWVVCGQTASQAESLARAAALAELESQCSQGYTIDLTTVQYNVSFITFGGFNCPAGYSGAWAYEASATACCCPEPLPTLPSTWGNIKVRR
jgi:hypothetical protein